jgi:site-specific recombinase XerD
MTDGGKKLTPEMLRVVLEKKAKIQLERKEEQHQQERAEDRKKHLKDLEIAQLRAKAEAFDQLISRGASVRSFPVESPATLEREPSVLLPPDPPIEVKSLRHSLSDLLRVWQGLKERNPTTVAEFAKTVNRFEELHSSLPVEDIEKRHIREYVAQRKKEGVKGATVDKEHSFLRALLTIAVDEEWITDNPARGIRLPDKSDSKRVRSFRTDEIQKILDDPVFTEKERPTGGKGEAAFWIPLLMLFSGARREEIASLSIGDVRTAEGVDYIVIGTLKKKEKEERLVPIHDKLLEIGFMDYVSAQRKKKRELFPLLAKDEHDRSGKIWGNWWQRYLRTSIGLEDPEISPTHSFRHFFITLCRGVPLREDYEFALVGHADGSRKKAVHDRYGEFLLPALKKEINRVEFRGLDFSRLRF